MLYRDESFAIVGAAIEVWKILGYGLREPVYERSLKREFLMRGIQFQSQVPYEVFYKGESVGQYRADLVAHELILIELKTRPEITEAHIAQTLNYLRVSGLELGLILNFGPEIMECRRVVL
ncbi:GxxExxY protein [Candidatus Poribacteria bacterium]|nr:GxxExxY protein [Candidatus Poribacteria bacterium]